MTTLNAKMADAIYDDATDVMYFPIGESKYTDEEEVSPGVHLLYAYDTRRTDEIVGIEIEGVQAQVRQEPVNDNAVVEPLAVAGITRREPNSGKRRTPLNLGGRSGVQCEQVGAGSLYGRIVPWAAP